MNDQIEKTQYHNGFYAAAESVWHEEDLSFQHEVQLGVEPPVMDFLIIKKATEEKLTDPVGEMFLGYNVFEYKSPKDTANLKAFMNTIAYALRFYFLTKECELSSLTATVALHQHPDKMLAELRDNGFEITTPCEGLYRIQNRLPIPVQIMVTSKLDRPEYKVFKLLKKGVTAEQIREIIDVE